MKDDRSGASLYGGINLTVQIEKMKATILVQKAENDNYLCDQILVERQFDLCKISETMTRGFLTSFIYEGFHKNLNIKFKCPLRSGYIFLSVTFYAPPPIPLFQGFICGTIETFLKTKTMKKFEKSLSMGLKFHIY
jgi:hypothetical protein